MAILHHTGQRAADSVPRTNERRITPVNHRSGLRPLPADRWKIRLEDCGAGSSRVSKDSICGCEATGSRPSHGVNVNGLIMTNGSLPGQPRPPRTHRTTGISLVRKSGKERAEGGERAFRAKRRRRGGGRGTYTRAARPHVLATHVRG